MLYYFSVSFNFKIEKNVNKNFKREKGVKSLQADRGSVEQGTIVQRFLVMYFSQNCFRHIILKYCFCGFVIDFLRKYLIPLLREICLKCHVKMGIRYDIRRKGNNR